MHYINISDLTDRSWRFLEPYDTEARMAWEMHHGLARNALERAITRPALARYRACLEAVRAARRRADAVLVSHLPNVTVATAAMARGLRVTRPHVAFAFNYTQVPTGRRLALSRRVLRDIEEFTVFSRYEIGLYAELFDLPSERFTYLPWAMEPPEVAEGMERPFDRPYFSAIGGEGRDYRVLAEAMAQAPELRLAIVARPASIAGIEFPDNVSVFTNLPAPVTWAIAQQSCGMAIALKSNHTPNGHVTMVGAQRLGIPLVVTDSLGVADYVDAETALMVAPQEVTDMTCALRAVVEDPEAATQRAERAKERAATCSDPRVWLRYFAGLDLRLSGAR